MIPNKREVECCASCNNRGQENEADMWCEKYDDEYVEYYWLCDDYEKES